MKGCDTNSSALGQEMGQNETEVEEIDDRPIKIHLKPNSKMGWPNPQYKISKQCTWSKMADSIELELTPSQIQTEIGDSKQ